MKCEPLEVKAPAQRAAWVVDEGKYFKGYEIAQLRETTGKIRAIALQTMQFRLVRIWFMIELGLHAGLRVAEMASLHCSDLFLDGTRSSILVLGKGSKKRFVWISDEFKQICLAFLQHRQDLGFSNYPDSYLLCNLRGTKISTRALESDFKNVVKDAALPAHYYIHCLRHTYATYLLCSSKYNFRFVQLQLGHVSIQTTQVYAGVLEQEGRKALEKLYP